MQVRVLLQEQILNHTIMGKIITTSLAKRKARGFFNDKKVRTLVKFSNIGGDEIPKGSIVKIISNGREKTDFNVIDESTGVEIHNNWCEHFELIEDESH